MECQGSPDQSMAWVLPVSFAPPSSTDAGPDPERKARVDEFFVGSFEHSLDAKGRIVLPAAFRSAFESSGYLIKAPDGCLALMSAGRFSTHARSIADQGGVGDSRQRNAKRAFFAATAEVTPDKQGRIAIPEDLRIFAQLDRECVVIGALDDVEIWSASRWAAASALGDSVIEDPDRSARPADQEPSTSTETSIDPASSGEGV